MFGIRAKLMARQKAKDQREAELYGIKKDTFEKQHQEKQQAVYQAKVKAQREAEISRARERAKGGSPLKSAIKEYSKYRKTKGLGKKTPSMFGGGGGGPQFGLDKKKRGGPKFGL